MLGKIAAPTPCSHQRLKTALALIVTTALFVFAFVNMLRRSSRRRVGSAAVGSVYDLLNKDKQNAIEIIVEGRAAAVDPEHKDGNPPDPSLGKPH
jgi:hypothetical protein